MSNDTSPIKSLADGNQPERINSNGGVEENVETLNRLYQIESKEGVGDPNQTKIEGGTEKITGLGPISTQETRINTTESAEIGGAKDPKEVVGTIGSDGVKEETGAKNTDKKPPTTKVETTPVPPGSTPSHIRYDKKEELFITSVVEDQMEEAARGSR